MTRRPAVIAHRGASGLRPEHTLEAYRLGIEQGADYIEPDLIMTRDGILVARHENEISGTTDVADHPEFADRRATKMVDGRQLTGWFTEDFTLAQLRSLRARERLPELRPASAAYGGRFGLVTLEEIIALVREESRVRGRPIGIVAELKHAAYFDGIGLPIDRALLPLIAGLGRDDPFFIECFEPGILRRLRGQTDVRLVQLLAETGGPPDCAPIGYAEMVTPSGLADIALYADAVGPAKALIVPRGADGASLPPTSLVADAHAAGLLVFPWTFRSENFFLPADLRRGEDLRAHGDSGAEYRQFYDLGVDAVFSDFPEQAVAARD
ncbi:glycerophosphodiester phosphodiesterase [Sphingosinicella sp. YJ22]|uniref:glycerophosphodiester phosphodiesterase n=1 Tax=Sphingosinicella sp. YJ22 TaxID=1104780 RepID=UPI00140BE9CA|nr:glycerophosphodiester phosphodiesterase [Sphingosinicella sp. YJ22]